MSQQQDTPVMRTNHTVSAAFPIAILESVRAHDRPGEILEDEDLTISLPRRLGLTGVVDTQIRRYETAQRSGRDVPLDEALGLLRLVLRRPDAEPILRETGQRVARWRFRHTPDVWTALLHRGPARFAIRSARRSAVRTLRALHAGSRISGTRPFTITVADCVTARLTEGPACVMFTALFEELVLLHTGETRQVSQIRCGSECAWELDHT